MNYRNTRQSWFSVAPDKRITRCSEPSSRRRPAVVPPSSRRRPAVVPPSSRRRPAVVIPPSSRRRDPAVIPPTGRLTHPTLQTRREATLDTIDFPRRVRRPLATITPPVIDHFAVYPRVRRARCIRCSLYSQTRCAASTIINRINGNFARLRTAHDSRCQLVKRT